MITFTPNREVYHGRRNAKFLIYYKIYSSYEKKAVTPMVIQGTATLHFSWPLSLFKKNLPCIKTFISIIKWLLGFFDINNFWSVISKPHNNIIKELPFLKEKLSAQGHGRVAMLYVASSLSFRLLLDLNVTVDLESLNVKWLHANCSNCLKMCRQVKPDPRGHCRDQEQHRNVYTVVWF